VTNTFSKRKDGFSYGFLFTGVLGVSEEFSFMSIMKNLSICRSRVKQLQSSYCKAGCEACTAQPPVVPEVVQVWLPKVVK
jgi:hypothetical protein